MESFIPGCGIADKVTDVVGVRNWGLEQREERAAGLLGTVLYFDSGKKFHLNSRYERSGHVRAEKGGHVEFPHVFLLS